MSYAIECPTCRGLGTTRIDHYDSEALCADCDGAGYTPRDASPELGEYDMPQTDAEFPEIVLRRTKMPNELPLYAVSLIVQATSLAKPSVSIRIWVGRATDEMAAGQQAVQNWMSDAAKGRSPAERLIGSGATRLDVGGAPFNRVVTFVDPSAYAAGDPEDEERGRQLTAEFPPAPDGGEDE